MANTFTATARAAAQPPRRVDPLIAGIVGVIDTLGLDLLGDGADSWHENALCRQVDPETFFPEKGESNSTARAICDMCPVKADCLAEAMDAPGRQLVGVWGGTSDLDRRNLRRGGWDGAKLKAYMAANDGGLPLVREGLTRRNLVTPYAPPADKPAKAAAGLHVKRGKRVA